MAIQAYKQSIQTAQLAQTAPDGAVTIYSGTKDAILVTPLGPPPSRWARFQAALAYVPGLRHLSSSIETTSLSVKTFETTRSQMLKTSARFLSEIKEEFGKPMADLCKKEYGLDKHRPLMARTAMQVYQKLEEVTSQKNKATLSDFLQDNTRTELNAGGQAFIQAFVECKTTDRPDFSTCLLKKESLEETLNTAKEQYRALQGQLPEDKEALNKILLAAAKTPPPKTGGQDRATTLLTGITRSIEEAKRAQKAAYAAAQAAAEKIEGAAARFAEEQKPDIQSTEEVTPHRPTRKEEEARRAETPSPAEATPSPAEATPSADEATLNWQNQTPSSATRTGG